MGTDEWSFGLPEEHGLRMLVADVKDDMAEMPKGEIRLNGTVRTEDSLYSNITNGSPHKVAISLGTGAMEADQEVFQSMRRVGRRSRGSFRNTLGVTEEQGAVPLTETSRSSTRTSSTS